MKSEIVDMNYGPIPTDSDWRHIIQLINITLLVPWTLRDFILR